ncbi:hypothetical protein [Lactiplantibacillus plantarum]|uniref:hypothetical protein n=1 Tax=Lactiplantibacillus plantarum TaxID=1590 RepID=UPI003F539C1F
MNPQIKMIGLAEVMTNSIVSEAKQQPTYAKALQKLKHDQDKMADYLEPNCPLAVARAVAQVTNAIYGEAIARIYREAKDQPIKEVPSND